MFCEGEREREEERGAGGARAARQFSCTVRSEMADYTDTDLFNTASHRVKRMPILYQFASNCFYLIECGSRVIIFRDY